MAVYPGGASTNADLYVAFDNFATTLNGAINNSQTTITLTSTSGLPTVGILTIESEKIKYTGISGNDITGVTRGFSATSAASHSNGTSVLFNVVEEHHNVLKDEIIAVESDLYSAISADLDDSATVSSTASSLKVRLDQIVTKIKEIGATADWKDVMSLVHIAGTETITGQKTFSTAAYFSDGSAATPGIAFSADNNVGLYRPGGDTMSISLGGTEAVRFDNAVSIQLRNSDGTSSLPAYSFLSDTDTGIFRPTTNTVGISTAASEIIRVGAATAADNTGQDTIRISSGPIGNATLMRNYARANVTTSALTIHSLDQFCDLIFVAGTDGPNTFGDLLFTAFGDTSVTVIASKSSGTPAARTYTVSSANLQLQMASGTYDITSFSIQQRTGSF